MLCKLCARAVVRVGVSLNLVMRSGVHGAGPTLVKSTPARQQIGLKSLAWQVFQTTGLDYSSSCRVDVILSHGIVAIGLYNILCHHDEPAG